MSFTKNGDSPITKISTVVNGHVTAEVIVKCSGCNHPQAACTCHIKYVTDKEKK